MRIIGCLLLALSLHAVAGWFLLSLSYSNREQAPTRSISSELKAPGAPATVPLADPVVVVPSVPPIEATEPASGGRLAIDAFGDSVVENELELAFKLKLSRPAQQPIIVIFTTFDGTAVAGVDYERMDGTFTFEPGTVLAELRASLIDDQLSESDEYFGLFLVVDPNVVDVGTEPIHGIIQDDD